MTDIASGLSDEKLQEISTDFRRDGFAVVENLAPKECVDTLKAAYNDILEGRVDCGELDRNLGGLTRQVMMPHIFHPVFADNEAVRNARRIAGLLIHKQEPDLMFSMAIYKPPLHPHETPWHQDMAYAGRPVMRAGSVQPNEAVVQFWVALDDVDEDMGCMEFVPGVQNNPLPEHFVASGDPEDDGRLLAMKDPASFMDLSTKVACPLKAGGATVHGHATPHYTGPNRSKERGRPAFIFSFANFDVLRAASEDGEEARG